MPRDDNHPFGHGKIELLSASLEGFLIIIAGLIIIYEAIMRLFTPTEITQLDIGIVIIAIAGGINFLLGQYSIYIGKKHHSIALISGGKHLKSDTYSTIGLILGLVVLLLTNLAWIDSAIAIVFGSIIIITGIKILRETTSNLMDEADFNLLEKMVTILWQHRKNNWIDIHNVKIVKYGNTHHIDCDIRLPKYYTIVEAHAESENLKNLITNHYDKSFDITIHIDACNFSFCKQCRVSDCKIRQHAFEHEETWSIESITKNSLKNMATIKITNAYILTLDSRYTIIENGCICIHNDTIEYIGSNEECEHIEAETVIDAQGNLVMPGLINSPTHAAMSIYKGRADDLPLKEWLEQHIFPTESEFCTIENVAIGTRLGILEMIMSGTTCFADMYYFTQKVADICEEFGMRAVLAQAILDIKAPDHDTPQQALEHTEELIKKYIDNDLVRVIPGPHSPYTCKESTLTACRELANTYKLPIHIHVSETIAEYNQSLADYAKTPVQYLNDLGLFKGETIAAHCVYISDFDRELLAKNNVSVVNNRKVI